MIKNGDTLKNGWTVIATGNRTVLAMMPGKRYGGYATWFVDDREDTYWGHYFDEINEAAADFEDRVARGTKAA
jgi:hypothetical protein